MVQKPDFKRQEDNRGKSMVDYWPLLCLILISSAAAHALTHPAFSPSRVWMHYFMGFFLCSFAMLKLFHPRAFADGFEMYDPLAQRFRVYGYLYPVIELGLGLAYLSFWEPALTYSLTILVMLFSSFGVVRALKSGLDINCPCMGSVLKVPLSTVTLVENISMALMAISMLIMM